MSAFNEPYVEKYKYINTLESKHWVYPNTRAQWMMMVSLQALFKKVITV